VSHEQRAVLSHEQQEILLECTKKSEVVEFLTPHFDRILDALNADLVVVNCEDCVWPEKFRDHASIIDLFVSHKALYGQKVTNVQSPNDARKFGVVPYWRLRRSVAAVFKAKVRMDQAAFREVVAYMNHVRAQPFGKAILFDQREFWLISSPSQSADGVQKIMWTEKGSEGVLAKFMSDALKWIELLKAVCKEFGVVAEECGVLQCGVLQCGESGRIFRVHRASDPDKEKLALKLVMGQKNADDLSRKQTSIHLAAAKCPLHVVEVEKIATIPLSMLVSADARVGGAMLLSKVGNRIVPPVTSEICEELSSLCLSCTAKALYTENPT
jgi:hypothetical protein